MFAFWSPFPPTRTGTADYALAVVRLLGKTLPLTVVVSDEQYSPASEELARSLGAGLVPARERERLPPGTRDVYFVANNEHHLYMLRRAETHPGTLVLHENALEYGTWLLVQKENPAHPEQWGEAFAREVARVYPTTPRVLGGPKLRIAGYIVPMTEVLVDRAKAVIVHNPVLAKRLSLESGKAIRFVPHPPLPPVDADQVSRAWHRLQATLPMRRVRFGSLGFASRYKRLPLVLQAYARFSRSRPELAKDTAFVLAGRMDDETRQELTSARAREDLGAGTWFELPYLSEAELEALLQRLDLVINLRFPSCGEASGMLTRCLQLGRPTVVSDHAYGGAMPDDVVIKLPVLRDEVGQLANLFTRVAEGKQLLSPSRLRHFAETAFSESGFARRFETCLRTAP